ncbi:replication protein [Burkholderia pseudomallei]|uniref:replication initiation protein n=2 Tax=Burkholderia pseudomallei TaxID=28450 RepID=UPI0005CAA848|nr:replication initiation protein [Burkholderia pseudomallei]KIX33511.1 replication protein [Burkholderia pseudomallei]KIX33595.1 replication protein [Burkholderia pseudomallei]
MGKTLTAKPNSQTSLSDRQVTMANAMMRSAHGLSLAEKRFIAAALAKTDSTDARGLMDERMQTVKLTAMEYAEAFAVTLNTAYEQLQAGAEALQQPKVIVERPTQRGIVREVRSWIITGKYAKGEGSVEVRWHPDLVPFLFGLRKEFTTYKLKHAAAFRSIYTWRIFECLKSWQGKGSWTPSIDEFHDATEPSPTARANFKELRLRVIEPAVKELREKNGLLLEWTPVKAGRKVIGLRFSFEPNPQSSLGF